MCPDNYFIGLWKYVVFRSIIGGPHLLSLIVIDLLGMVITLMRIMKVSLQGGGNWDEKVFIATFCDNVVRAHFIGFSI